MKDRIRPVLFAFMAAVFYAVNTPLSKILLESVPATFMAAFLYLGAGTGVGIMYLFRYKQEKKEERLGRDDLPYTVGMVLLDILAPILLMLGIRCGSAANASLLGNFEIVATTMIAFFLFREGVSRKLAAAIGLITLSSIILSFEGGESMHFSIGSIYVLLAASCWGLENNCTRKISEKSSYQIVTIKGLFSGAGSFVIAVILGEKIPDPAAGLCRLWSEHLSLCQSPEGPGGVQDQCLLCLKSLYRGFPVLPSSGGSPDIVLYGGPDHHGRRNGPCGHGYHGKAPHAHAYPYFYPYP